MGITLLLKTNYSIDDTKSVVSEAFEKQIDFVHSRFIKFDSECKEFETKYVSVHGFKGSAPPLTAEAASLIEKVTLSLRSHIRGVQGSILVHRVHLGSVFMRKASASSGLIQNLELNWQLLGKMSIFNDDFGSSSPYLSLTLNVER